MSLPANATKFLALAAVWAGWALAPGAAASTMTFTYDGTVESCPDTGIPPCGVILFEGDAVGGPFVVDAAAVSGSGFDFTDVVAFSVMVGQFFAVSSDNSALVGGKVQLDGSGLVTGGSLTILATALPDAPPTEVILDFDTNTWLAQALIPGLPDPVFIASGTGSLTPVPLPGALGLLIPALGALGVLRRRRNA